MKIVVLLISLISTSTLASEGYKCIPNQAFALEADGSLSQENGWAKLLIKSNKEFVVDRATGKMIGSAGFSNHNASFGSPRVLDHGSAEQSFKALTVFKPNVSVAYLKIEEFHKGKSKPFIFLNNGNVVSGACEHY
jgi:hypothetical protein